MQNFGSMDQNTGKSELFFEIPQKECFFRAVNTFLKMLDTCFQTFG